PVEGDPDRVLAFSRDATEHRVRERELERKNERLDRFASLVSHDLRNPLHVAEGRLELAREECESEHLEGIASAHDRMATLIEDLLTLARQGDRLTEVEPVDLGTLARRCWGTVQTPTGTLTVVPGPTILADRTATQTLLENLIRNAVEHGGDDVTVTIGPLEDDEGFYVGDDGPGIPPSERDSVFEAGYSTTPEGTGFGLSIVEEIAEAHDWEVAVTESADGGARFEITGVELADGDA
ncbi:MAG: HAMP domain-containing sensor histidine kinase, partial [Haloarculaceae archaeon]